MKTEFISDKLFESDMERIKDFVKKNEFSSSGDKLSELLNEKGVSVNDFIRLLHLELIPQRELESIKKM